MQPSFTVLCYLLSFSFSHDQFVRCVPILIFSRSFSINSFSWVLYTSIIAQLLPIFFRVQRVFFRLSWPFSLSSVFVYSLTHFECLPVVLFVLPFRSACPGARPPYQCVSKRFYDVFQRHRGFLADRHCLVSKLVCSIHSDSSSSCVYSDRTFPPEHERLLFTSHGPNRRDWNSCFEICGRI